MMPWQLRVRQLIGMPVGISLQSGQGRSGVLCGVANNTLYLYEYIYRDQFAIKQISFRSVQDVNPFPPCRRLGPVPFPQPPRPVF